MLLSDLLQIIKDYLTISKEECKIMYSEVILEINWNNRGDEPTNLVFNHPPTHY
jgi:hypothetical protein